MVVVVVVKMALVGKIGLALSIAVDYVLRGPNQAAHEEEGRYVLYLAFVQVDGANDYHCEGHEYHKGDEDGAAERAYDQQTAQ